VASRRGLLAGAALLLHLGAAESRAQQPVVTKTLEGRAPCTGCTLDVRLKFVLQTPHNATDLLADDIPYAARDGCSLPALVCGVRHNAVRSP
jgi:hypothetical protein